MVEDKSGCERGTVSHKRTGNGREGEVGRRKGKGRAGSRKMKGMEMGETEGSVDWEKVKEFR